MPSADSAADASAAADTAAGPAAEAARARLISAIAPFTLGALAAAGGILPALLDGGRLPLQNLWTTQTLPEDMPFALLPVSQYQAITLLALLVMGGVVAGLAVRVIRRRRPIAARPVAAGLLVVHTIAIVQSFVVVADGVGAFAEGADDRGFFYFTGMLTGVEACALLALLAFRLTSRRSVGPVALGVGLAAVPFASWIGTGIVAVTGLAGYPPLAADVLRWLPALIVGLALAWCGVKPVARLGVWAGLLLALWLIPALFTATAYALGMRVLDGDLAEMADAGAQVFGMALWVDLGPVVVAAAIGAVGVGARMLWTRSRR
ncbi:hypothetical protein FB562_2303 [Homoserinimonas aerilata]|uniref:Uncharacterized protein n=1 Tax=Homoserinimonas aerilata TaxID=1162970 RepID=A0A542YFA8_9MICO|nr:hypothetical protein FB562_2303 [Homoserinimonas aerilata]